MKLALQGSSINVLSNEILFPVVRFVSLLIQFKCNLIPFLKRCRVMGLSTSSLIMIAPGKWSFSWKKLKTLSVHPCMDPIAMRNIWNKSFFHNKKSKKVIYDWSRIFYTQHYPIYLVMSRRVQFFWNRRQCIFIRKSQPSVIDRQKNS